MAVITATDMTGSGARTLTETTLGESDTLVYDSSKRQVLTLRNDTAGALTPNIDGAGGTTVAVAGIGSVDVSSGITLASIGAAAHVAIPLDSINKYLQGTVTVSGGDGIVATIMEF
jgi:hypothetical protein